MSVVVPSSNVLVTGANGYIASHIVNNLLKSGYYVKGTVRNIVSAEKVTSLHSGFEKKLSIAIVPNITDPGAFHECIQGIDMVIHVASPFSMENTDFEKELLIPAIKGTQVLLETACKTPSVKRVVMTSSFAAMYDFSKGLRPGHVYSETDFNQTTYEDAKVSDSWSVAYCTSKALAEKAAWDFVDANKPHFSLTVINPPKVFGPSFASPSDLTRLNISANEVWQLINGSVAQPPKTAFWAWIDVRDVSLAHVRALEVSEACNHRIFVTAGRYTYTQVCGILRQSDKLPEAVKSQIPVGLPDDIPGPQVYDVNNSKSRKLLNLEYRTLESSVVDAAVQLLAAKETASKLVVGE